MTIAKDLEQFILWQDLHKGVVVEDQDLAADQRLRKKQIDQEQRELGEDQPTGLTHCLLLEREASHQMSHSH